MNIKCLIYGHEWKLKLSSGKTCLYKCKRNKCTASLELG